MIEFVVAHFGPVLRMSCRLQHGKTIRSWRGLDTLLVRRLMAGDENDAIQRTSHRRRPPENHMPLVNWIEGATEQGEFGVGSGHWVLC